MSEKEIFEKIKSLKAEDSKLVEQRHTTSNAIRDLVKQIDKSNLIGRCFTDELGTYCKVIKDLDGCWIVHTEIDTNRGELKITHQYPEEFISHYFIEVSEEKYLDKLNEVYSYYE